jgi:hypothetical protein
VSEEFAMSRLTLSTPRTALYLSAVLAFVAASPVAAQSLGDLLQEELKEKLEQATGKASDEDSTKSTSDTLQRGRKFYFAPTFGVYLPTMDLAKLLKGGTIKQEAGLMVGGRLGMAFSRRIGLQVSGTYVPSNVRLGLVDDTDQTHDASLFFGAGKLSLSVLPSTSPVSLQLNGGVAVVNRSGAAYRDLKNKNSVGATVGGQLGIHIDPLPPLQLAVDTYLYKQNLDGLLTESGTPASQKDVQLSIGFGVPIGK